MAVDYNFMADCQSRGFDKTYLSVLSILSGKFTLKPGCISRDQYASNMYHILGDDISISLKYDNDNHILHSRINSLHIDDYTSVGHFYFDSKYKDGLSFPIIYGSLCNNEGYFRFNNIFDSDDNISNDGIKVCYYDNEAIKYLNHNGGSFESNFIEPDREFILQTGDEKIEDVLALIACGWYNGDFQKAIRIGSKVYCKK